jgi:hypothetical protein
MKKITIKELLENVNFVAGKKRLVINIENIKKDLTPADHARIYDYLKKNEDELLNEYDCVFMEINHF